MKKFPNSEKHPGQSLITGITIQIIGLGVLFKSMSLAVIL
jgi:hypothetical protein